MMHNHPQDVGVTHWKPGSGKELPQETRPKRHSLSNKSYKNQEKYSGQKGMMRP